MHYGLYSNMIRIASIGSSCDPQDFRFPIFAMCFFTSSNERHSTGPSVVGNSSSCSLGFSALKSLSKTNFHLPLIFPRFCPDGSISVLNICYVRCISTSSVSAFGALNTKAKVNTRKNILRKLTNSRWGAHPATVRTTALALCFSTAEYTCSSWGHSRHTGHVDIALNDTCRIINGCVKATPIPCLYALASIAPPHIRRKVAANADRCIQEDDPRHPLHGQRPAKHMLPSRNSFRDSTEALSTSKQDVRTTLWVEEWNALGERSTEWRDRGIIPNEHLASGTYEPWSTWRSLNRLRVLKGRCRGMMKMWKLSHTNVCDCGRDRLCIIL